MAKRYMQAIYYPVGTPPTAAAARMVETEDAAGYVEYSDYCNLEQKYNMLASALAVAWSYLGPFVGGASFKEAYDAVHSAIYLSEDTLRIEGDALAERNEGKGRPS